MPTNPSRTPSRKETASLSASRASWGFRRWLSRWWPVLFFALLALLVGVAFDTQTAFVFVAGVMMGAFAPKGWA
jgi:hypothetical protein